MGYGFEWGNGGWELTTEGDSDEVLFNAQVSGMQLGAMARTQW
jgi:hypothetical protein